MCPVNASHSTPDRPRFYPRLTRSRGRTGKETRSHVRNRCLDGARSMKTTGIKTRTKIAKNTRGIVLPSPPYGRTKDFKDLCEPIEEEVIEAQQGVERIVSAVKKRDPISVGSLVYQELQERLATSSQGIESYRNFESLFAAQLAKFNSFGRLWNFLKLWQHSSCS